MKLTLAAKAALVFLKPSPKSKFIFKSAFYRARYNILKGDYSNADIDCILSVLNRNKHVSLRHELNMIREGTVEFRRLLKCPIRRLK